MPGGGAGPFAGGSLVDGREPGILFGERHGLLPIAQTLVKSLLQIQLGTTQMGPPISFTIDGKQYIAVTAAQGGGAAPGGGRGGGGAGAGGGGGATPAAPRPANLLVLALDGKAPLPGATPPGN